MESVLKAGIVGVIIAFVITLSFFQFNLLFFPSLVASLIVIYLFELKSLKDATLAAFTVYLFADWILNSIPILFSINETFTLTVTVDEWLVINQLLTVPTALIAGMLGAVLAGKRRHIPLTPQPPPPPPPQPPQVAPSPQIAETKFCRYCGTENKTDAVFCEKCGKNIG